MKDVCVAVVNSAIIDVETLVFVAIAVEVVVVVVVVCNVDVREVSIKIVDTVTEVLVTVDWV